MRTQKGYIGERFDPETGLQYLNARYYDPKFGRLVPAEDAVELYDAAGANHHSPQQSRRPEASR
jgi:RHS repeat-associated protein